MSSATAARGVCPRCSRRLVKNHGSIECLACGTLEVPLLSRAAAAAEVEAAEGRRAPRGVGLQAGPPWTENERLTWKTWKEGDPVPGETENERDERATESELRTLDTAKLASLMVKSLRGLALELGRLKSREEATRAEAKKLSAIVALCGGAVPAEVMAAFGVKTKGSSARPKEQLPTSGDSDYACDKCARLFATAQGRSLHQLRTHGPGWDTTTNLGRKEEGVG